MLIYEYTTSRRTVFGSAPIWWGAQFNEPIATSSFDHGEHEVKGAFVRVRPLARGAAKLAEKTRQEILIRRTQRSHEEALPSFEIRVVNGKHIRDRHL